MILLIGSVRWRRVFLMSVCIATSPSPRQNHLSRLRPANTARLILALALIATIVSAAYTQPLLERISTRTSSLSGAAYLCVVLLSKNPRRCFEILRIQKETFASLCHWTRSKRLLADNRCMSVEEQILRGQRLRASGWSLRTHRQGDGEATGGDCFRYVGRLYTTTAINVFSTGQVPLAQFEATSPATLHLSLTKTAPRYPRP